MDRKGLFLERDLDSLKDVLPKFTHQSDLQFDSPPIVFATPL